MNRQKAKQIILISVVAVSLFLGYNRNFWGVVSRQEFSEFDIYSQSQVIGRVIRSETTGIFSEGGLNGWVKDDSLMKGDDWDQMTRLQFDIYKNNISLEKTEFVIYDSQLGGQGIIFALLDRISPFNNKTNLSVFWLLTSVTLALLMTLFTSWTYRNYSFRAAFITFIMLIISPWLTLWGRNLYMVYFSFFLAFIIMLISLESESAGKKKLSVLWLFMIPVLLVFTKLFFSGFEFITSFLVMLTIPLFYYWFSDRWKTGLFIRRFSAVTGGSIMAIIIYSLIYSWQLSTLKGSFGYGLKYMIYSFLKRTHGNSADFPEGFKDSLDAGTFEVISNYLKTDAIKIGMVGISFGTLIIFLIGLTLLVVYSEKISVSVTELKKKLRPLLLTTWVSLLGPLSWFVIFKAHAYVHTYYDEIVWYMPFCLFLFVLIGIMSPPLVKDINAWFEKKSGSK